MNVVFGHIKVETCVFAANHINQERRISAEEGCENHESQVMRARSGEGEWLEPVAIGLGGFNGNY